MPAVACPYGMSALVVLADTNDGEEWNHEVPAADLRRRGRRGRFPGDAAQAAGLERADLEPDEAAEGHQKVRFGSVDVRPVWWREAA